jgi:hypothetical protein
MVRYFHETQRLDGQFLPEHAIVLPGGVDTTLGSEGVGSPYFHRDSGGKTCFSESEATRASERLQAVRLVEQVRVQITTTNFVLPQVRDRCRF